MVDFWGVVIVDVGLIVYETLVQGELSFSSFIPYPRFYVLFQREREPFLSNSVASNK